jgi:hypothetical protein
VDSDSGSGGGGGMETIIRPRESNFLVQIRVRPPLGREIEVIMAGREDKK